MEVELSPDLDLSEHVTQVLLCLFVLGGIALVLCNLVLGETSVSSRASRTRKSLPCSNALDADIVPEEPPAARAPLLPRVTAGMRKERRGSLRRKGNPVGVVVVFADDPAKPEPGLVIDRSRGGLCLSLPRPVAVGTKLHVRTCHAPEDLAPIVVVVRHCAARGDRCHLGCQFVEAIPWGVLLLFG